MNVLVAGNRIGPYEIVKLLGTGGMGEVYHAHDTRLNREVALKVLPPHAGADPGRNERLVREARLISTLNHPHIRAVYDAAEYDGVTVIVMEYVEGETLDHRLARRPLSLGAALTWAQQLASALDAVHTHGIVHHDVKPANVMVTTHGVKLLDFGIATQKAADTDEEKAVDASTVTDSGSVPGTTAYMAPEQLEGAAEDPRSDIFGLGVVMYEMLTGRKPFEGATRARMIAAILEHEPPAVTAINAAIPAPVARVVTRCLAKDPSDRWQTARDLASELEWLAHGGAVAAVPAAQSHRRPYAWALVPLAALVAIVTIAYTARNPRAEALPAPVRFIAAAPPNSVITVAAGAFAISPDGRHLAFTAASGGGPRLLWIRSLDSFEAHALSGTDDAGFPFWSPDSRTIAFFTGDELKTVDISGSPLQIVTKLPGVPAQWGGWGNKGDILFTTSVGPISLYRVRASGGPPQLLVSRPSGQGVGGPEFLPDGEHFLLGVVEPNKPLDQVSIYVGSFANPLERLLVRADSQAIYAAPGYVLYMRAGSLIAHPFDANSRQMTGEPVSVPEPVAFIRAQRRASFSISQNGILAYRQGISTTQLTWFDRSGRRLGTVGAPGRYLNPAISPDASAIAVARLAPSFTESDIWLFEPRGERKLTSSGGLEDYAVWSPDGRRMVYSGSGDRLLGDIYVKETASSAEEPGAKILESSRLKLPMDWTSDGLVFLDSFGLGGARTFVVRIGPHHTDPLPLSQNPAPSQFSEDQVQVSPDARWMAYVSDVSGSAQVYVRKFPDGQRRWQVSTEGGFEPKWRGDGRELFYIAADQQMMSVTVDDNAGTFTSSRPIPLFRTTVLGAPYQNGVVRNEYAVTRDGERFLMNEPTGGSAAYAIRVLVNWRSLLAPSVE